MENPAVNASISVMQAAPEKWRALLDQFEDVLAVNIFIVDAGGQVVVPLGNKGAEGGFGSPFIKKTFAFDLDSQSGVDLTNFEQGDTYLQVVDPFDLHVFAVPIAPIDDQIHFYLVIGPMMLSRAWPDDKYLALAQQLAVADDRFLKDINTVAQMSVSVSGAILDLLAEVVKDVVGLELEKQKLHRVSLGSGIVRPEIIDAAQDIFVEIQQDELLVTILDSAIKMANVQGGSIMVFDDESQEFTIRVSRGLENKKNIMQARIKMGEGIAGLAAKRKVPLFINGADCDDVLRPFLKRPEIKHSIIIPLVIEEKVIGVLNLCTNSEHSDTSAQHIVQDVHQLSRFIATALHSL
jgi:hypothetical protein